MGRESAGVRTDIALLALELGLSPVAPMENGSKRPYADIPDGVDAEGKPKFTWKPYSAAPATAEHIQRWFTNGRASIGLATGYGDVECFEFDNPDTYDAFLETAVEVGLGALVDRIRTGYEEFTPGGGVHWLYYCDERRGNAKLAERPIPGEQHKRDVLVETRGEGGFIIIAPSNGRVHPAGGAYKLVNGGLTSISTLLPAEREELWALARTFDEMPDESAPEGGEQASALRQTVSPDSNFPDVGKTPGDDFAAQIRWEDILEPFGWRKVFNRGGEIYWRRPDKDHGVSATTGHTDKNALHVFSTSTCFKTEGTYTKLGAFAALSHSGDIGKAIKALAEQGYGTWIDNDGTEKQNPVPKGWKRTKAAPREPIDLSWITTDYATLADADRELRDTAYAWDLWIPRGSITAIVADPGVGKTRVVAEWCKRLWFGEPMPDGVANPFPAGTHTLWLCYDRNWRGLVRSFTQFGVPRESVILPARRGGRYGFQTSTSPRQWRFSAGSSTPTSQAGL